MARDYRMEHIDRLTRGRASGAKIGSRAVGHHLHKFEREIYERALKKGYLDIDERSRTNLTNVWMKVCVVKKWPCVVLVKSSDRQSATVFLEQKEVYGGDISAAKKYARELVNKK